jgi:FkbM family methyltransferase
MLSVSVLNFLHRKKFRGLLTFISQSMYFIKGYGFVPAKYHPDFRAYEYKVKGTVLLSLGPGWAYSVEYLKNVLQQSFCFEYLPKAGDCVVDVGSGLGEEVVVYALLVGASGSVHALEANPSTYKGLNYMCEQNHFSNVKAHHLAIYKTDGEVTIEDDEANYLGNTINSGVSKNSFVVKAKTLDTLVKENGITRIDFLKSNIEGAEQYMIEGMKESISIIRNFCISCHDFRHVYHNDGEFYMTKEKIKLFLERNGFEIIIRNTGDRLIDDYVYARNTKAFPPVV